jgi:hypothetical protein
MKIAQPAFPRTRKQQRYDVEDAMEPDSHYISTTEALCYVVGTMLVAWALCGLVKFLLSAF